MSGQLDARIIRIIDESRARLTAADAVEYLWEQYDALVKIGHVERTRIRDEIVSAVVKRNVLRALDSSAPGARPSSSGR